MTKEMKTRDFLRVLRAAGWSPGKTVGSHTKWRCPGDNHSVPVPDGHRMISPGVIRSVAAKIDDCDCTTDTKDEKGASK
ncbi:type II toxin-antitoxin system HicA family toxin [Marmoricola sp. URHB0036]|uniref:type II toxin-antitoxin system HicA family toxin n=1 Tax=Marmoricola sp. URHB0036 TaxID=1298863 RepID=UPI0018C97963|nr:type II toxin-antitoxin system HicA family toxin [Marmoricola sp. URHB0036]